MQESEYIIADKTCFHCGDKTEDSTYVLDNHRFCCLGCQTVYQILNENNLESYYRYNTHPGKSQKKQKEDLSYLDEPNIIAKLVDYQDDQLAIMTFYIPAIHCSSCIWLLENLYKLTEGVKSSKVSFSEICCLSTS